MNNLTNIAEPICQRDWPPCGIVPTFVIIMSIKALFGLVGFTMNADLIYVTIKNRSLHHTCNILIALNAFGLAIYQLSNFPSLAIMFNGRNVVKQDVCFAMQSIPLFGKTFSLGMMLAIGLDRLRSVAIGWHLSSSRSKFYYCICCSALSSALGIYFLIVSILDVDPKRTVECSFTSHISQGPSTDIVFNISLVLNLISPCIYIFLGLNLYLQQNIRDQHVVWTRKVFKSIFVIMLIELLGWGSNSLYVWMQHTNNVLNALSTMLKDKWTNWIFNKIYSYIVCIALVANVPALYFCSSDYNKAFKRHFRQVKRAILEGIFTTENGEQTGAVVALNTSHQTQIRNSKLSPTNRNGNNHFESNRNLPQIA